MAKEKNPQKKATAKAIDKFLSLNGKREAQETIDVHTSGKKFVQGKTTLSYNFVKFKVI